MMHMGVLLAAGASTRFGIDDKLLALWKGRPLVTWAAQALSDAGCGLVISVTTSPAVAALLPAGMARRWIAPGLPMSASLRLALREARDRKVKGLLVCLGDMPNVTPELLGRLMAAGESAACVYDRRCMPPAFIAAGDFDRILSLPDGDFGAREVIAGLPPDRLVPIGADAAHDVDRPSDVQG